VPVLGPVAGIAGNVRRPAIYEMKDTQTIGDLIQLSGGILPTSQLQNVVIERIEGHQRRVIRNFNLDPSGHEVEANLKIPVFDGDVIKLFPVHDRLRQVVYLEGHVKYPMAYELKPDMRISALIPSFDSLLPEPYLKRADIVRLVPPDFHPEVIQFNLDVLLSGDISQDLLLKDSDRIIIYAAQEKKEFPTVSIKGEVRKPGSYRLFPGMTIKDLIFTAGNLTHKAFMGNASLTRVVSSETGADIRKIGFAPGESLSENPADNLLLKQDDEIYIHQIPNYTEALKRRILLEGEVIFPGEYAFSAGERLNSVIERAGGLTAEAYAFGAMFFRESVKEIQRERLQSYVDKLEEDVLMSSSTSVQLNLNDTQAASFEQALIAKKQLLEKLRSSEPTGRMVIELEEILSIPSSKFNFELKPGDRLVVHKQEDHINVLGEVYNPTGIFAEKGRDIDYYLNLVGGVTGNAETGSMYIVQANGSVISKSQDGFFGLASWDSENKRWALGGFESTVPRPGDTIIVPRKTEKYLWWSWTKDIVDVMYKVALAAGVLILAF
jgi:protein involved in polysaccharide export with SLBB domain